MHMGSELHSQSSAGHVEMSLSGLLEYAGFVIWESTSGCLCWYLMGTVNEHGNADVIGERPCKQTVL